MSHLIESRHNETFRRLVAISNRKEKGLFLVEGARQIERALASGFSLRFWVTTYSMPDQPHILLSQKLFSTLSFRDRLSEPMAVLEEKRWSLSECQKIVQKPAPLIAVVDGLDKPGNLGAIFRSADGAGVDLILIAGEGVDCYNRNVICSSTGALFSMPFFQAPFEVIASWLAEQQIPIAIADPERGIDFVKAPLNQKIALVFGREECGLDSRWHDKAAIILSIPMRGQCDSLNVSVSAALLFFEARRQRS